MKSVRDHCLFIYLSSLFGLVCPNTCSVEIKCGQQDFVMKFTMQNKIILFSQNTVVSCYFPFPTLVFCKVKSKP